jgi:hypothetical protein
MWNNKIMVEGKNVCVIKASAVVLTHENQQKQCNSGTDAQISISVYRAKSEGSGVNGRNSMSRGMKKILPILNHARERAEGLLHLHNIQHTHSSSCGVAQKRHTTLPASPPTTFTKKIALLKTLLRR